MYSMTDFLWKNYYVWPPVAYAAVVYSVFAFLDRKAAPHARRAIAGWVSGPDYNKGDVAAVIIYLFDRLYSSPLLGVRAFLRCSAISLLLTAIVIFQFHPLIFHVGLMSPEMRHQWTTQIIANILSDYIALFLVRRWLVRGGQRPLTALCAAPLAGLFVIIVVYLIRDVGGYSLQTRTFHFSYFVDDFWNWVEFLFNPAGSKRILLIPVIAVHLWLPLLALGILISKSVNYIRAAGRFSQWFFSRGQAHPLRSIGYIAAAITFLAVAAVMLFHSTSG
jgi:hypothetical protein